MMRAPTRLLPALLPLTALAAAAWAPARPVPAPAPPTVTSAAAPTVAPTVVQDDAEAILTEKVLEAADLTPEQALREGRSVARIFGDELGAPFDRAVDAMLRRAEAGPHGDLFLVAARLEGDEPDAVLLAEALGRVLEGPETDAAVAAAEMTQRAGFEEGDTELRRQVAERLIAVASDGQRAPSLRVRAAVAAHQVGLGDQVHKSQRVLHEFLSSSDPVLRADGALGLAGLGIMQEVDGVVSELERLSREPGAQGRLAEAYLKQLQIRRFKDTELRRAKELNDRLAVQGGPVASEDLQRVERLIDFVQNYHIEGDQVTRDELLEAALNGILQHMDPHSSYFGPEAYKRFEQDLEAEYGGIGAYVGVDREDGLFTITRPIYSGPAYKAGLGTDDKIVRVDDWPTIGEETDAVIKRLKGKPGTTVKLYVWRTGMDPALIDRPTEDMAIEIERAAITVPPVHYEMLPGKVGLVELTTFSRVASRATAEALFALMNDGAQAIVLDLRNNTGGLLDEARNVADLFLPPDKVVARTENRLEGRDWKTQMEALVPAEVPVAVLINRFSASAAEIVSGALQDHGRAKLVGQRSFGKGSVQNLIVLPGDRDDGFADENNNRRRDEWEPLTRDLNDNGEFDYAPRVKLTVERYLLPSGRWIHRQLDDEGNVKTPGGVEPDETVAQPRYEGWELKEMRRIQNTRKLREWATELYRTDPETVQELALYDGSDWKRWPGFDELFLSLGTALSRDQVRFLVRLEARRLVQDARGSAFPMGDFEEDRQLQHAIALALEGAGKSYRDVPEFAASFGELSLEDEDTTPPFVAHAGELRDALALVSEAEAGDRTLSDEELEDLRQLLRALTGDGE